MIYSHKPMNKNLSKFRGRLALFLSLGLCLTTLVACGGSEAPTRERSSTSTTAPVPTKLADGKYTVQQATYNDANGEYSLFLLNTPPGTPSAFQTTDLQMAQLTDAEVSAGQKDYLQVEGGKAALHLSKDSKLEYVHNVTETKNDPQTGQPQTVVVRQESSFWTPFAGAIAGAAIGNLLFAPRYYVPPVYGGGPLVGYGGYGNSYGQAVQQYQSRYQAPPAAVRNQQANLRTTGRLGTSSARQPAAGSGRATGSGFGSSTLGQSDGSRSQVDRSRSRSGFGSGRSRSGARRR